MGFAIIGINTINSQSKLSAAYSHNYRVEYAENADKSLATQNKELISLHGRNYTERFDEVMQHLPYYQNHQIRKNAILAVEVVTRLSIEDAKRVDMQKWQQDNLEFIRKKFNANPLRYGDNVVSSVFHADEIAEVNGELKGTYHMHTLVIPIDQNGRLNYSSYIDGPRDMSKLQTDYAKAMESHGLKRGIEKSIATHESMKRFYGGINKALQQTAPEIIPGESIEEYKTRADEAMKENAIAAYATQKAKEHELVKKYNARLDKQNNAPAQLKEAKKAIRENQKIIKELRMSLKETRHEKESLEHEFGSWEEITQKLESLQCLSTAFQTYPDQTKSDEAKTLMNEFILYGADQRKKEKERKEKKER